MRRAFTVIELLTVVAVLSILGVLLLPALRTAKARAYSVRCISNLRQLGIATRFYADNNNGRLFRVKGSRVDSREILNVVCDGLQPTLTQEIFKCPSDKRDLGLYGYSYEWNAFLSGRVLHRRDEESGVDRVYLFRDQEAWHLTAQRNAVFLDGHAGRLTTRE